MAHSVWRPVMLSGHSSRRLVPTQAANQTMQAANMVVLLPSILKTASCLYKYREVPLLVCSCCNNKQLQQPCIHPGALGAKKHEGTLNQQQHCACGQNATASIMHETMPTTPRP